AKAAVAAASGLVRTLGGGISPVRSFRMTFSQISGCAETSAIVRPWRERPAVFSRSLWQLMQYLSVRPGSGAAGAAATAAVACVAFPCAAFARAGLAGWLPPCALVVAQTPAARTATN